MKALFYHQPGLPEVLQYESVEDPVPGPRDVIVKVVATALNHLDVVQRKGWFAMPGFSLPHIAGMDVVGIIAAVGSQVTLAKIGDRVVVDPSLSEVPAESKLSGLGDIYGALGVIGATVAGGYAELCLVPETHVHPIPGSMTWHRAATFPTAWLTAWHAIFEVGKLQRGETIMIHAAGSGVSVAAIQLAKYAGATVLATAGTDEKCEQARKIGVDFTCNNRTSDVTAWAREVTRGVGVDIVFDHVGPALWAQSMFSLKPRGRLVNCGNTTGDSATIPSLGFMFHMGIQILGSDPYRFSEFAQAWKVFTEGNFQSPIDSIFPLSQGAQAQEKMLSNNVFGKILLEP